MRIRFLVNGSNVDVDNVVADKAVGLVKKEVSGNVGVAWDEQRWVYKGKVLSNTDTLGGVGFADGDAIHLLKGAKPAAAGIPPSSEPVRHVPVPYFDAAMGFVLSRNSDEEKIKNCLITVSKVLKNIMNKPFEEKYRKLKASNTLVQQKILVIDGSRELLASLGFMLVGEEYVLQSSGAAWNNILACNAKLQSFLMKFEHGVQASGPPPASANASPTPITPNKAAVAPPTSQSPPTPAAASLSGNSEEMQLVLQQFAMGLLAMSNGATTDAIPFPTPTAMETGSEALTSMPSNEQPIAATGADTDSVVDAVGGTGESSTLSKDSEQNQDQQHE